MRWQGRTSPMNFNSIAIGVGIACRGLAGLMPVWFSGMTYVQAGGPLRAHLAHRQVYVAGYARG
jgi:hypothetical protein